MAKNAKTAIIIFIIIIIIIIIIISSPCFVLRQPGLMMVDKVAEK